ncbi:hypothetical protein F9949_04845 [Bacteroides stercoris]|uniref:Uncharacterized protein n=1 Tax=Bacteroides stercoris TaxID=46506 RepID=A0A6A2J577_BACSE|nr:hypothetical protein F9952_12990 [Bacteroides stercoris]KAB5319192.1 hypothetical protein F9949_04845 [Bacteroides stercoris]KAB5329519.1 hypothetical protein F9950_04785 [Bacteroides stercoris]KAB5335300.1 hypothetical protein F9956_05225 [Bacteroides stercoris]KAB5336080.1 hypothetical protein F9944_05600 [Bacteroides stercoris]
MFWLYNFVRLCLSTWRNYGIISALQIFPYKFSSLSRICLTFYWYIQEIYAKLLCILNKESIKK